ncbi:MAG: haloacid dehalogenase type II [Gammaproteobacteria bacterium]|nr:haloacid dehalogenase type II [Gammaproteobacteria bacterium]MDH4254409.1 haloacid dehalogenase type II [Gammaproteobacteria bacterium]
MARKLGEFKVLSFDCYGTLIDWEAGIWDALQPLLVRNGSADLHRSRALQAFGRIENRLQLEQPGLLYTTLLERAHHALAEQLGLATTAGLDRDFGASLPHWPAFRDSADALRYLKTRYRLVVLSNVSRAGFAASNRKLGVEFDAVYTAEDIGSYKPADANFEYLLRHLRDDFGFEKRDVLHTAQSLRHDHVPARKFGLANAWIDRQRLSESGDWGAIPELDRMPAIDYRYFSMADMADAVRAEGG